MSSSFALVPSRVVGHIGTFLDTASLAALRCVNKTCKGAVTDRLVLQALSQQFNGGEPFSAETRDYFGDNVSRLGHQLISRNVQVLDKRVLVIEPDNNGGVRPTQVVAMTSYENEIFTLAQRGTVVQVWDLNLELLRSFPTTTFHGNYPAFCVDDTLIAMGAGIELELMDKMTGAPVQMLTVNCGGLRKGNAKFNNQSLYFLGHITLSSWDKSTGQTKLMWHLDGSNYADNFLVSLAVDDDKIYVAQKRDGKISVIDKIRGQCIYTTAPESMAIESYGKLYAHQGFLYCADRSRLHVFDSRALSSIGVCAAFNRGVISITGDSSHIYLCDVNGRSYAINKKTQRGCAFAASPHNQPGLGYACTDLVARGVHLITAGHDGYLKKWTFAGSPLVALERIAAEMTRADDVRDVRRNFEDMDADIKNAIFGILYEQAQPVDHWPTWGEDFYFGRNNAPVATPEQIAAAIRTYIARNQPQKTS